MAPEIEQPQVLQPVPKANPRNNTTMFQIFQNVQYNVVQHKKYVKEMTKLYKKMDQDAFSESFSNALHYLFTFGDTSANVDRVIQFVATFCTSLDDEEEFLLFIFDVIFNCQCVSGQSVRYRASQLLAAVLAALGDDASLDDDLCDKLLASQMQRLQDTRGAVRCRAALALQRLQNPSESDDGVTRAYRFHMSCDPSSSVRRAIVMSIAKCTRNVPFVLERLCDVDEAVRRAAFLYIAAINVTQLRVRQRVLTLKVGLTERSPRVRRVVEEILIPGWLSSFKGNVIHLLKAIRLDNSQDAKDSQYVAGKLLESLFKRLPASELLEWLPTDKTLRVVPPEKLNKETAWYWRHLAEHLHRLDDDETFEAVMPDLVVLAGYIRAIVETPCPSQKDDPVEYSTRQYVLQELATLLKVYDASDQVGRTTLQKLISDVLTGDHGVMCPEVTKAFVSALALVLPEVSPRVEFVSGVISELREPSEPDQTAVSLPPPPVTVVPVESNEIKMQKAKLRVSLNVAMEAQEEAVHEQNYALAAECKARVEDIQRKLEELNVQPAPPPPPPPPPAHITTIREKVSDEATLNKCLTILNGLLDNAQITSVTPLLNMIFTELEVEIFQNPDVLENALETVALYGMLDKEFAKDHKAFFFAQLIDTSDEKIVTKVLMCIVDLLCVHGAKVFEDEQQVPAAPEDSHLSETSASRNRSRTLHDTRHDDDGDGTISESAISLTPAHSTVIELLLKIMDSPCSAYRLIIVEGLCRLFMLGHLESPGVLSRLLLLWFNPATVEEDMLRQTIGVFFQSFASGVEGAQEQIQKATVPTLRALANAPASSPIAEINQEAVVRFVVSLTRVNQEAGDSQGALAVLLCSYLARHVSSHEVFLICRTLALLSPPRDVAVCADLARSLRKLCSVKAISERAAACRHLTRYLGALEAIERSSLNKVSTAESTIPTDDLTLRSGRATSSLPQPIARSTHVVINETVEEEPEEMEEPLPAVPQPHTIIEETDQELLTTEENKEQTDGKNSANQSSSSDRQTDTEIADSNENATSTNGCSSDSSGVSPVKKPKVQRKGRRNLSLRRSNSGNEKALTKGSQPVNSVEGADKVGVKRTRSQRSLVDVERARQNQEAKTNKSRPRKNQKPVVPETPSNVTLRPSRNPRNSPESTPSAKSAASADPAMGKTKGKPAGKPLSRAAARVPVDDSPRTRSSMNSDADETELHTIVYEPEFEQSLLNDSDEAGPTRVSRSNVTIPETPDNSQDSESEDEQSPVNVKPKSKRNAKK